MNTTNTSASETPMNGYSINRLQLALQYLGWSKTQFAARSQLGRRKISGLLNGNLPFTDPMAERLMQTAGFPVSFLLLSDGPVSEDKLTLTYDHAKRVDVERVLAEYRIISGMLTRLRSMANVFPDHSWMDDISPEETPSVADIRAITQDLRTLWGMPASGPVSNVTRFAERNGIVVVPFHNRFGQSKRGVSNPSQTDRIPLIGYFPIESDGGRLRFDVAHELGHLILHRKRMPADTGNMEFEADVFASMLLMPEMDTRDWFKPDMTLEKFAYIKGHYGINITNLITHAAINGIIDSEREHQLRDEYARFGWVDNEPVSVESEFPILLKQVVGSVFGGLEDYRTPSVSKTSVEGFLGLPFDLVNEWCDSKLLVKDDFSLEGLSGD